MGGLHANPDQAKPGIVVISDISCQNHSRLRVFLIVILATKYPMYRPTALHKDQSLPKCGYIIPRGHCECNP